MRRLLLRVGAGVAALALLSVAFTGCVDLVIGHWLKLGVHTRDYLRLAFVANSFANTLNLSGAVGAGIRVIGLTSQRVELPRAAALIALAPAALVAGIYTIRFLPPAPRPAAGSRHRWHCRFRAWRRGSERRALD